MKLYRVMRYHRCIFQSNSFDSAKDFLLDFMEKYDSYYYYGVSFAFDDDALVWATVISESCYLSVKYIVQHEGRFV